MLQKLFFLSVGHVSLGLGLVGIFLPILPTTPFLILACGCYGKSSERFQQLLLSSRLFGPLLQNWRKNRSISLRAKYTSLCMIGAAITHSVVALPLLAIKIGLVFIAVGVSCYIITRPSPPTDRRKNAADFTR